LNNRNRKFRKAIKTSLKNKRENLRKKKKKLIMSTNLMP